ncbi:MAG: hypothetical protein ACOYY2_14610 [Actinomycetota bacterium]
MKRRLGVITAATVLFSVASGVLASPAMAHYVPRYCGHNDYFDGTWRYYYDLHYSEFGRHYHDYYVYDSNWGFHGLETFTC